MPWPPPIPILSGPACRCSSCAFATPGRRASGAAGVGWRRVHEPVSDIALWRGLAGLLGVDTGFVRVRPDLGGLPAGLRVLMVGDNQVNQRLVLNADAAQLRLRGTPSPTTARRPWRFSPGNSSTWC